MLEWLKEGKDVRLGEWKHNEVYLINEMQLLTAKPCVFLCNLSEKDYVRRKNKWLVKVHQWVQEHGGGTIIPFSGALEQKLVDMPEDEAAQYLASLGENVTSALTKIIKTGFSTINLIYFFTAGQDEVKCWTIRKGFKAPQAAGTIHTDFERGFICAVVMSYDDLHEAGSESEVKAKGKYRQEGKAYVVKDGDVIFFKVRRNCVTHLVQFEFRHSWAGARLLPDCCRLIPCTFLPSRNLPNCSLLPLCLQYES